MAQNSTQITGIVFSELKAEEKQLVTENEGKMLLCQNFNRYRLVVVGKFPGPLEGEGVEVGTLKHLPRTYFSLSLKISFS